MLKFNHKVLMIISGMIWVAVGLFLLPFGLHLLVESTKQQFSYPLIELLRPLLGSSENVIILLIALGLSIGYVKGKYVLGKSAKRCVKRIVSFPNPTSIANIYSPGYYLLLGLMIGLGMSIKFFGVPNDVRGFIDVTIGSALINGAMIFFRYAVSLKVCVQSSVKPEGP